MWHFRKCSPPREESVLCPTPACHTPPPLPPPTTHHPGLPFDTFGLPRDQSETGEILFYILQLNPDVSSQRHTLRLSLSLFSKLHLFLGIKHHQDNRTLASNLGRQVSFQSGFNAADNLITRGKALPRKGYQLVVLESSFRSTLNLHIPAGHLVCVAFIRR